MSMSEPQPGQRWSFHHGGLEFEIEVTELRLEGAVTHGRLLRPSLAAPANATVIAPTASVRAGHRVT